MKVNKKRFILLLILSLLLSIKNVSAIEEYNNDYESDNPILNQGESNSSDITNYAYNYNSLTKQNTEYEQIDGTNYYKNEETGFIAFIDDGQDLITTEEEKQLLKRLESLTEYGNAGFVTTYHYININLIFLHFFIPSI